MDQGLDSFDLKILSHLQMNNQVTGETLAERVGLSPSAAARRIRRLRSAGIIEAEVAVVAPQVLGDPLFAIVQVQLERHARDGVAGFLSELMGSECVQFCFEVSGAYDVVVLAVTNGMADFNHFADELLAGHQAVRRYETSFVKKRLKATLALPLPGHST